MFALNQPGAVIWLRSEDPGFGDAVASAVASLPASLNLLGPAADLQAALTACRAASALASFLVVPPDRSPADLGEITRGQIRREAPDVRLLICDQRPEGAPAEDARAFWVEPSTDPRVLAQMLGLALRNAVLEAEVDRARTQEVVDAALVQSLKRDLGQAQSALTSLELRLRQWEEDVDFLSQHDAITGLPNRAAMLRRIEAELGRSREVGGPAQCFAVFLIALRRFRVVNVSLGNRQGDHLLSELGKRLKRGVRERDLVARLGGDEFGVVVGGIRGPEEVQRVAQRLMDEAVALLREEPRAHPVDVAMGVAVGDQRHANADEVLRDAGVALCRVRMNGGSGVEYFDDVHHGRDRLSLTLEADLAPALERGEFTLHYQPIVEIESGRIAGFEGLLRWQHPVHGAISPGLFIPVAEKSGLITTLGSWVLDRGCQDLLRLQHASDNPWLFLTLNASRIELSQEGYHAELERRVRRLNVDPSRLFIEITESATVDRGPSLRENLAQLRRLGVGLLLDDFGVGQSSLSALAQLPVDGLKIDRAFVSATSSPRGLAIMRAIAAMGHALGLALVAEGIEVKQELEHAASMDCKYAQGFLFGCGVGIDAAQSMLEREGHAGPLGPNTSDPTGVTGTESP